MKLPKKAERLAFFQGLYEENKQKQASLYDRFDRALRQYEGSPEIDFSTEKASVVRNITYELIESEVSVEIPQPKADAAHYTEHNDHCARAIERLCLRLRQELPFERLNDLDERYTYIFGGSVWLVEWDESLASKNRKGGVRILCVDPRDFVAEAGVEEVEQMEFCFLRFRTGKNELCRRYGISAEEAALAESAPEDSSEESALVIVCFYRGEEGQIGQFAYSGSIVLRDFEDYYARRQMYCADCGKAAEDCRCDAPLGVMENAAMETPTEDIFLSDGGCIPAFCLEEGQDRPRLVRTKLPYYTPHRFPIVIRRNISEPGQLFGSSDCDTIRPQQQQINKLESRIQQKLMRSGVTPMLPDDAEITLNNSVFGQLIRLKPGDDRGQFGVLDTTPSIAQEVEQAARIYDHAKRILGITDTYSGFGDTTAQSGVAKRLLMEQSAGRLQSKRKMKEAAYAQIDRLIFEYHLAFADEKRPLTYSDAQGRLRSTMFYRYDFLEHDLKTGEWEWNDDFLFSADQNSALEQQRETMWQKNLENLRSGALGDPGSPATLLHYWQCQERVHYPFARENVEFFRRLAENDKKEEMPWQPLKTPFENT